MSAHASGNRYLLMGKGAEQRVADGRVRRKYNAPELVIYGTLVELTRSGKNDPPRDILIAGSVQTG